MSDSPDYYLILDGVHRAAYANGAGHSTIRGFVTDLGTGVTTGPIDLPINQLMSPKPDIVSDSLDEIAANEITRDTVLTGEYTPIEVLPYNGVAPAGYTPLPNVET